MDFIIKNLKTIVFSVTGLILLLAIFKNFSRIKTFLFEVWAELKKVSWSTRQELIGSTVVVIMLTFIMGVYIGGIDLFLSRILSLMFR